MKQAWNERLRNGGWHFHSIDGNSRSSAVMEKSAGRSTVGIAESQSLWRVVAN